MALVLALHCHCHQLQSQRCLILLLILPFLKLKTNVGAWLQARGMAIERSSNNELLPVPTPTAFGLFFFMRQQPFFSRSQEGMGQLMAYQWLEGVSRPRHAAPPSVCVWAWLWLVCAGAVQSQMSGDSGESSLLKMTPSRWCCAFVDLPCQPGESDEYWLVQDAEGQLLGVEVIGDGEWQ